MFGFIISSDCSSFFRILVPAGTTRFEPALEAGSRAQTMAPSGLEGKSFYQAYGKRLA